jgi:hypothetical protein
MFEIHCPNCGWTSTMGAESQTAAVAEADRNQATHHIEHCPRCQWVIRIPVEGLRSAAPAEPQPDLLAAPEKPLLLEAEKSVEKPAAKKPAAKKPAAKKAAAKKPVAKKPATKKAAAKKPVAKKSTAKKPAAKKPAAKKPVSKTIPSPITS